MKERIQLIKRNWNYIWLTGLAVLFMGLWIYQLEKCNNLQNELFPYKFNETYLARGVEDLKSR